MKRTLFVLLCCFLAPAAGYPDAIAPGYHSVQRDVVISNISSFPDNSIVAYVKGPMIQTYEVFEVLENVPLDKGYYHNTLNIFVVNKTYLTNAGGVNNVDFDALAPSKLNSGFLEPALNSVPDENPLAYEKITYEIQGVADAGLTLRITQRLLTYNDGTPDRVEEY